MGLFHGEEAFCISPVFGKAPTSPPRRGQRLRLEPQAAHPARLEPVLPEKSHKRNEPHPTNSGCWGLALALRALRAYRQSVVNSLSFHLIQESPVTSITDAIPKSMILGTHNPLERCEAELFFHDLKVTHSAVQRFLQPLLKASRRADLSGACRQENLQSEKSNLPFRICGDSVKRTWRQWVLGNGALTPLFGHGNSAFGPIVLSDVGKNWSCRIRTPHVS